MASNIQKFRSRANLVKATAAQIKATPPPPPVVIPVPVLSQNGEFGFTIDPNSSIKVNIVFPKEFAGVPIVSYSILISEESEFEITSNMTSKTSTGFVVCVQSINEFITSGTINWIANMPTTA